MTRTVLVHYSITSLLICLLISRNLKPVKSKTTDDYNTSFTWAIKTLIYKTTAVRTNDLTTTDVMVTSNLESSWKVKETKLFEESNNEILVQKLNTTTEFSNYLMTDYDRSNETNTIKKLNDQRRNYHNFEVFVFMLTKTEQLVKTAVLENEDDCYFWSDSRGLNVPITIIISKRKKNLLKKLNDVKFFNAFDNPEDVFADEREYIHQNIQPNSKWIAYNYYNRYDAILDYLKFLPKNYPTMVKLETIGKTVEGREIVIVEVNSDNSVINKKGSILIEAGIHGRDWASVSAALYFVHQAVENLTIHHRTLKQYTWYILPVLNPDGYEYSYKQNRLWKKNRAKNGECTGVDLDRNFRQKTNDAKVFCGNYFGGISAFSELESQSLKRFLLSKKDIKLYLSLRNGGCFVGYPWTEKIQNVETDESIYLNLARILRNNLLGDHDDLQLCPADNLNKIIGNYSGSSVVWAKEEANVNFAFVMSINKADVKHGWVPHFFFDVVLENFFRSVMATVNNYTYCIKTDTTVYRHGKKQATTNSKSNCDICINFLVLALFHILFFQIKYC